MGCGKILNVIHSGIKCKYQRTMGGVKLIERKVNNPKFCVFNRETFCSAVEIIDLSPTVGILKPGQSKLVEVVWA